MFDFSGRYDKIFPYIVGLSPLVLIGTTSFYDKKSWKIMKKNGKTISARNKRIKKIWKVTKSVGLIVLFCVAFWLLFFIMYKCFKKICQFIVNDCKIRDPTISM